jgi:hypothetical protein
MRMRGAAALVSLVLVVGCGGGDDFEDAVGRDESTTSTTSAPSTTTPDGDQADETIDDDDIVTAVDRAQLEIEDFEPGWTLTSTDPPDDGGDEPDPMDECLGAGFDRRLEAATIAESDERSFSSPAGDGQPIQMVVTASSLGLDDGSLFDDMHDALRADAFGPCLAAALQEQMGAETGAELVVGEIASAPGTDPESTGVLIPFSVTGSGMTVDVEAYMLLFNLGPVGSLVFVIGTPDDEIQEMAHLLGDVLVRRITED